MKYFKHPICCLVLSTAIFFGSFALSSYAAETEGSMDSMWSDHPGADKKAGESPGSTDLNAAPTLRTEMYESSSAGSSGTTGGDKKNLPAELCAVETFLHSGLVTGNGWPGVGPFRACSPGPYSLIDSAQNKLGLSVDENKVVAAELDLTGTPGLIQNFVNLQMNTDFLLEALGARPSKIHDLNAQLEKNQSNIATNLVQPVMVEAAPYSVLVEKPVGSADSVGFRVRVSDKAIVAPDKVQISMAQPEAGPATAVTPTNVPPKFIPKPRPTIPPANGATTGKTPANASATAAPNPESEQKYNDILTKVTSENSETPANERGLAGVKIAQRKKEFVSMIDSWQKLKKSAVKTRTTTELSNALSGEALRRQTEAIKWLQGKHWHYDMNPKGVNVTLVEEKVPDKAYLVHAQVKEASKLIDDTSGQIVKESDEVYNVIYTVEQVDDKWFITDSRLIKPQPTATPPSASAPKH
jgi:ARC6-like, IMS domain